MRGDSPAICQSCRFLLACSGASRPGPLPFISDQSPAEIVCLQGLVSLGGPFCFSSISSEDYRFPFLVASVEGFVGVLHLQLPLRACCGLLLSSSSALCGSCPSGLDSFFQAEDSSSSCLSSALGPLSCPALSQFVPF